MTGIKGRKTSFFVNFLLDGVKKRNETIAHNGLNKWVKNIFPENNVSQFPVLIANIGFNRISTTVNVRNTVVVEIN